ncbi:hypothetical protein ABE137_13885 [Brevibacillus laterosporus]|uniref:Uncharacterized protein n=1 Tax=Brevibacillus halotolerans TaxID=1507437 RepID=A0ABT4I3E4_9BACL|nr:MULTISPECIES: hypothetical protein [Brevibacillus]ERM17615.1 hypothetical protein P615_20090 [Brevibacillus laterosporus PE36]MBA4532423.1 hypothetical protein [Brevibacillus halotolerans]MCR8965289.1 hypothetical protein [Brevibacillus laterosporus]MCR8987838.1 hypothetical protein [Brevibacillus laterosporus]MCR8996647.1 hypothetical protein [Brevibacillus laterosporus]
MEWIRCQCQRYAQLWWKEQNLDVQGIALLFGLGIVSLFGVIYVILL